MTSLYGAVVTVPGQCCDVLEMPLGPAVPRSSLQGSENQAGH